MKKAYPQPPAHFDLSAKLAESKGARTFYRFNPVGHSSAIGFEFTEYGVYTSYTPP